MEEHVASLKEHLASQNNTMAILEKNSSIKDDIITNLRSIIAVMEKQLADLKEQTTLRTQITEAKDKLIINLRGDIVEQDEKPAAREGVNGDKGKKGARADHADMYLTTVRDFQPLRDNTTTGGVENAETSAESSTGPHGNRNLGANDAGQTGSKGTGTTAVLAGNTALKTLVFTPGGVTSAVQESEGGEGDKGEKGKGLLGRWK